MDYYYKPIKIKSNNLLFIGCAHLNHDKEFLWGKRGFEDCETHKQAFIQKWNETADEETIAFSLGDFQFGHNSLDNMLKTLDQLRFKEIYMLPGNHFGGYKQLMNTYPEMLPEQIIDNEGNTKFWMGSDKTINLVPNYLEIIAGTGSGFKKMNIVLNHYAQVVWNGNGKGSVMLYSHSHNSLRKSELGRLYEQNGKCLEVSVERAIEINEGRPFTLKDIRSIMSKRDIYCCDHHDSKTQNPF